ncbi:hypothetical protein RND81_05G181200 [Saponaria officinalis]|uniref:F-box domain-containing protein n=1 Tax=Saponaria officinalis TaxID=3572 RepID=A0AAW1L267_SAPOF
MSDVNPCISKDIWFEILKCLPVKTLGKCRCVCKSWHSLIISETFMPAHLKHYTQNGANSLLLHKDISKSKCTKTRDYEECSIYLDSTQLINGNILHTSVFPFALDICFWPSFTLVGSVHGLLCLSDSARVFVWNPLLQKCIKLPASMSTENFPVLGFGFDDNKNDHRVVKISYCHRNNESTTTPLLVEVYSVQERTWKNISPDYLINNSINNVSFSQCFLKGVVHWLTPHSKYILLFNVIKETFDKMKLPEDIVKMGTGDFGIFEHRQKLAVSYCDYLCLDLDFDIWFRCQIWIKQDYNDGSSWCRILNVGYWHDCHHTGPVQFLGKNDELIGFAKESNCQMMFYDLKTEKTKEIGLLISQSTKFCAFSESLVLLDQNIDQRYI